MGEIFTSSLMLLQVGRQVVSGVVARDKKTKSEM